MESAEYLGLPMNCPSCSAPMLFGSKVCACGNGALIAESRDDAFNLSYWEALRAYWRLYWPSQALGFFLMLPVNPALVGYINFRRSVEPLAPALPVPVFLVVALFQFGVMALLLLTFVPRILSRPYRDFSLITVLTSDGQTSHALTFGMRRQLWFFLLWRQVVAGFFAILLAAPLNMVLSTMRIQISTQIGLLSGLFVVGPILIKMLVGHAFSAFLIEARRGKAL